MNRLHVVQNEVTYKGAFSAPLFGLWGSGAPLLEALYTSFSPFGISLANIRSEELSKSPTDQSIVVQSENWIYRWRIERVELTLSNFNDEDLRFLPKLLNANDDWMKKMGVPIEYSFHQFSYAGHLSIEEGTSQQVLERLPHLRLGDGQELRAAGQILHWSDSTRGWQGDLVVDHSQVVSDGLFLLYSGVAKTSKLDYDNLVSYLQERLDILLSQFGLRLEGL